MKLIIAYLQPEKLPAVKAELQKAEIGRLSATNALGCGSQLGYEETYRGAKEEINLLKKIRLEIAVNDDFEEKAIAAITTAARTGAIGDGKIFVVDLLSLCSDSNRRRRYRSDWLIYPKLPLKFNQLRVAGAATAPPTLKASLHKSSKHTGIGVFTRKNSLLCVTQMRNF